MREALQIALETGYWNGKTSLLFSAALYLAEQNQPEWATEVYYLELALEPEYHSEYFEDLVGKTIARVEAQLSPEVVAEAKQRGQSRDLETTFAELIEELNQEIIAEAG